MKLQQPISGQIDHLVADGSGAIPRPDGKPFLVYNTIPGETVNATVVKRLPEGHRSKLDAVVSPSSDRVEPRCPYAGTCGGCKWQHISYPRQLVEKLARLKSVAGDACPNEVIACPDPFYYRNRMDFVFGRDGELGMKLPDRWWATLDLETCFLLSEESVGIVNDVRAWAKSTGLPFWNSKTHEGFFRYLVIREGKNANERMVTLVTSGNNTLPESFVATIGDRATSIVHGINARLTDLSVSDELIPLKGDAFIHEVVNGTRYKITPNAFFQTNTVMAAKLQDTVRAFCGDLADKTLLDLYCGSGFFSLNINAKRAVGIEEVAEAIECAKENAAANNVPAEYVVSKAEDFDWTTSAPDVVIVDPPRAGMHPKVIETLLEHGPKTIVYVSCKYERFFQEFHGTSSSAPALSTKYRIAETTALDLFPHTPHIEFVAKLERL
ncbi:23S rRNA (uracil(1939)-C(5))-methyltransferase RlmD [bacterium]|nr:23S rRNA (uracil(1939)-C(5))-methyltransferase RlmD [bacterium]